MRRRSTCSRQAVDMSDGSGSDVTTNRYINDNDSRIKVMTFNIRFDNTSDSKAGDFLSVPSIQ